MGLGVALFAGMGFDASAGALAGLMGAAALSLVSGLAGATVGMISAPNGPVTMLLAASPSTGICLPGRLICMRLVWPSRTATSQLPTVRLEPGESSLDVMFSEDWLSKNPLTRTDLVREADYLKDTGFELSLA